MLQAADLALYSAANVGSNFKGLLLLTCVNALLYNVVHYLMIQRTSAVTTTVLGEIKIVGLLFASAFLLGEAFPCIAQLALLSALRTVAIAWCRPAQGVIRGCHSGNSAHCSLYFRLPDMSRRHKLVGTMQGMPAVQSACILMCLTARSSGLQRVVTS